ncbi:MAG: HAD family hydrolase, partial [Oscillospiraceae bacterium]|nr:HAD family hydrolase [Oscillospiraceae bacterium]
MRKITTVLFDLDGTLLPMEQESFVGLYFKLLAKKLAPKGYDPEKLIAAIWSGTQTMIQNDGKKTNEEAFWDDFCSRFGEKAREDEPAFAEFYHTDFQQVQGICGFRPEAKQVISHLQEKGLRIILATNPIFPAIATESRIRWAGMETGDFELYTTYENSR